MMVIIFSGLSLLAITAGGILSAFSARRPMRLTSWVSAYLVLVVGTIQFGLITGWQQLNLTADTFGLLAFVCFNLGNFGVIMGTIIKNRVRRYGWLVNGGGLLIAVAMVLLLIASWSAPASLALTELIGLAIIILISMPVGLILSSKKVASHADKN